MTPMATKGCCWGTSQGATHTHYSLGRLLDYPSGVLHILTGCFWTTSQGPLTGYTLGVLLDYLSGVLHLPTNYTHGVLLGYPGHAH